MSGGADLLLISRIVDRAMNAADPGRRGPIKFDLVMSLDACHNSSAGRRIDLTRMAAWRRDIDLVHDVYGIHQNIDQTTGALRNCFVPRFAAKKAAQ